MSAILYTSAAGKDVTTHSYSSGQEFVSCPRKYWLKRGEGWREKGQSAAAEFGRCLEDAVQFHVTNNLQGGVEEFSRLWKKREGLDLTYKDAEGDWFDQQAIGEQMMKLFALEWTRLCLSNPRFQLNYEKEVFPGTHLAGLNFTAYVDMWAEIQLGSVAQGGAGVRKPVIIDIKTSRTPPPPMQFIAMDPQLRSYAWVSGVSDVGFLWFQKMSAGALKRGDKVSLLEAGAPQMRVWTEEEGTLWLHNEEHFAAGEDELKGTRGKVRESIVAKHQFSALKRSTAEVTKQRLHFSVASISPEAVEEQGRVIGRQIADIEAANRNGEWPQRPGIKFPDAKCTFCPMRGLCLNDDALRDELIENRTVAADNLGNDLEKFFEEE